MLNMLMKHREARCDPSKPNWPWNRHGKSLAIVGACRCNLMPLLYWSMPLNRHQVQIGFKLVLVMVTTTSCINSATW